MKLKRGLFISALGLLGLAGCKNSDDFLHYRNDAPAPVYEKVHKVKDLAGNPNVDILWVIDNSGSMDAYQRKVIDNTAKFMNIFVAVGGLKWRMGLLSTDTKDNPYLGFGTTPFDYASPDPVRTFQNAVTRLGTSGSGTEKSFLPVLENLEKYPKFARPGAIFATIFVTDAPEQSGITASDFMAKLKLLIPRAAKNLAYAVLGPVEWCTPTDDLYHYPGSPYETYINATGGKAYKICDPNFGVSLSDMAKDLVSKLSRPQIFLEGRPKMSTLHVAYRGQDLPGGLEKDGGIWYYDFDNNAVVFYSLNFAPGDQEEVKITFTQDDGLP